MQAYNTTKNVEREVICTNKTKEKTTRNVTDPIFYTTLSDQISFEQADIGKTVFLTCEEAEKALEAMKDG